MPVSSSLPTVSGADVTVGIPVLNNGPTLRRAVESVLAQTVVPQAILIFNNGSVDETDEVGRSLASEHPIVRYARNTDSLMPADSFKMLLEMAETRLFMWLAADDHLRPGFIGAAVAAHAQHPHLACAVSLVQFTVGDQPSRLADGTASRRGEPLRRVAEYLAWPGSNARVYGLHRADVLRRAMPPRHFHAWDWALMGGSVAQGEHLELPEVLMVRDESPTASYVQAVVRDNMSRLDRIFPLLPMTRDLVLRQRVPLRARGWLALLFLNLQFHADYTQAFHSRYYRWASPILQGLLWRLGTRVERS